MRVYLDNCCYNRPFDGQDDLRVRLETEAKLEIQSQMRIGVLEYVWSEMLSAECARSPYVELIHQMYPWEDGAIVNVEIDEDIVSHAKELMKLGIKSADAIHLACAVSAECDWFFTVDDGILKKVRHIGDMRVANPVEYYV